MLTAREVLIAVISALLGGTGLLGIAIHIVKRYIDKKLDAEEAKANEAKEFRQRKAACEERMTHALGRWVFWMNRWVETGEHNGELRGAYEEYEQAEKDKKALDQEILIKYAAQQKKG